MTATASTFPERALVGVHKIPRESQGEVLDQAGAALVEQGGEVAAKRFASLEREHQVDFGRGLVRGVVQVDPRAASVWLEEYPELQEENLMESVAGALGNESPDALFRWVADMPLGSPRDAAVSQMVKYCDQDPEAGLIWLTSMGAGERKQAASEALIESVRLRGGPVSREEQTLLDLVRDEGKR